ncbi:CD225/dispanin family protein [Alloprevotella tannerae]|jgi:interferon-induced transmembrane protein|uniref:CD225/dispanin family protein n=1 Tax=Alloprevotella tannerae TaxID=76122 RepID=UPI001CB062DB|nr:CD225/dispanin family protein [Alloprevotella tannerae]MBF0950725.1 CD225/dispanin family protein [Alloprevotella tannerae]MBF0953537.1 CD225/dispanin family protein [Alloprevotella tannerae]DAJ82592.1 MAG TPA: Interferon-induced transmembrane protein [Caudoviricetes sp.]
MKQYYYVDGNNQQQGPIDAAQLPAFGVTTKTLVWCEGMANWQAAGEIPELASFFAAKQPEIPVQPQMQPGTPTQPQMQQQVQPQPMNINNFQQTQQPMNTQPPFQQPNNQQMPPQPDNYLVWAILVTVLCCLPFGVASIIYSVKVGSLYAQGDYNGAVDASQKAKKFAMIGGIGGLVFIIVYVIFMIIAGAGAAMSGMQ